jgi:hypothetical protein
VGCEWGFIRGVGGGLGGGERSWFGLLGWRGGGLPIILCYSKINGFFRKNAFYKHLSFAWWPCGPGIGKQCIIPKSLKAGYTPVSKSSLGIGSAVD